MPRLEADPKGVSARVRHRETELAGAFREPGKRGGVREALVHRQAFRARQIERAPRVVLTVAGWRHGAHRASRGLSQPEIPRNTSA